MIFGNSDANMGGQQSSGGSPEVVPIDTSIKSKIPRPLPPDMQVVPPNLNMPGSGLPNLNVPAPRPPSLAPDPNDPKYKMGIGGRIMGTVANFLNGATGRGPVVNTGKGALNSQYYRDEENRLRQSNNAGAQPKFQSGQQGDYWDQMRRGGPQMQAPKGGSSTNESSHEKYEY